MTVTRKISVLLMCLVMVLTACSSHRVKRAWAFDYLWGYEEMDTGAYRVWLRHDSIAAYCTVDSDLIVQLKDLKGEFVEIEFTRVKWDDEERSGFSGSQGCSGLSLTSESATTVFKLLSVKRIKAPE
jgi:hypothetical protein